MNRASLRNAWIESAHPDEREWASIEFDQEWPEHVELADIERLRAQNKAYAESQDKLHAHLVAKVAKFERAYAQAKERMRGSPVDWTNYHGPNDWWRMTSQNNRDIIMAVVMGYADRLAEALASTKGTKEEIEAIYHDIDWLDIPQEWFMTPRELAQLVEDWRYANEPAQSGLTREQIDVGDFA